MPVITDADLQQIANLAADLALKDDCDILGESDTPDPLLGSDTDYIITATVKCMIVDLKPPQEFYIGNQVVGKSIKKVSMPLGTVILKSNLLRVQGVTYKVIDPLGPSSYAVFSEAIVVETTLQGGN
jgi:hypothetical protein